MDGGQVTIDDPLRHAARLSAEFAQRAAAHDRDGSFPFENFDALHESGLLNLIVPAAFGGAGRGPREAVSVIGTLAGADASTALVLLMHWLQTASILRSDRWPARLRAAVIRDSVERVSLINALRVEPELGTPARGGLPATTARRVPEGWRINGRKIYATGSPILRYAMVWARTDGDAPLVGMFLVPMATPGIRIEPTWDHLGMRASGSHDVLFEDVLVPADHAVDIRTPQESQARDPVQSVWSAIGIAALYDGVANAARNWLVKYLHQRKPSNLGASLATLPRFQEAMGRIESLLAVNRMLIDGFVAQADCDAGAATASAANLVKLTATDNAIAAVGLAMELTGNPGLSRANPLERYHRDVLCSRVHTPQNDMILLAAGRRALGV